MKFILALLFLLVTSPCFADCLLLPVIGTGTDADPYRPSLPPGIQKMDKLRWSAHIPAQADGKPKFSDAYVCFPDSLTLPQGLKTITRADAETNIQLRDPTITKPKPLPEIKASVVDRIRRFAQRYFAVAKAWAALGSDAFSRADNVDLGLEWDTYQSFPCQISSNTVTGTTVGGVRCLEGFNAYIPTAAQYVKANVIVLSDGLGSDVGVMMRLAAPDTYSAYICRANDSNEAAILGATSQLQRRITGTLANLASDNSISWATNDEIKCEASGSNLTFYRNGSSLLTASDGTHTSGRGGVFVSIQGGVAGSDGFSLDNFEVSDLGGSTRRPVSPIIFR